jgi:hypothetical protein
MYSLAQGGAVARAWLNVAVTGSTALNAIRPMMGLGAVGATAAVAVLMGLEDTAGSIVCSPGNMVALGAAAAFTSASVDVTVVWEEVPV